MLVWCLMVRVKKKCVMEHFLQFVICSLVMLVS